ncbi:MAG: proteasome accessory factor PafA2 family protein [Chthoniobacterales bacterium]
MKRVFGIETEYGITVQGVASLDVVAESIELVRSYAEQGVHMKWDYALEDPHRDARGFRAPSLLQDTDESAYIEIDRKRPLSFEEIKSDLVLSNGARFYNDHAHPEYSTPECTTVRELVAQEKAGERILAECARYRTAQLASDQKVRLFKNNTDFAGHSYGCHENYLTRRDLPWERLVAGVLPFLITRQIFAGAGKLGIEAESGDAEPGQYQISQRADFFTTVTSIDTMNKRPLVNTRDEPHAEASRYRRFHAIIGDSNMSEWATALKIGTTALVLGLIENGQAPAIEIAQPVNATKSISRDKDHSWIIELSDGRKISAIDVQRLYLEAVVRENSGAVSDEISWLLHEWEIVLDDLAADVRSTSDRVDWVAKKFMLESFREQEKLDWSDPWLQAIDLEYHNIEPEEGLFYELVRQGSMRTIVDEEGITAARLRPPETTRAWFRGRSVARFNHAISSIQWDEIRFSDGKKSRLVKLPEPAEGERLEKLNALVNGENDFEEFFAQLSV